MKEKRHKHGFKVPEDYFDNFEKQLFNKIELETIPKETGFKVPDGYFDKLEDTVIQKLNAVEKPQKIITLNSKRTWGYITAIAASLVIIVSILIKNESLAKQIDSLKTAAIENYIDEGYLDLESYEVLALLDDEDLANMNLENDIFSEESLEDYLLEISIEETLLIE